jgi:hypothetical protein
VKLRSTSRALLFLSFFFFTNVIQAQLLPAGSNSLFWFAHLADGGPDSSKWITVFRFVNGYGLVTTSASGTISFFDTKGKQLALDFGSGPVTSIQVNIPPAGAAEYKTTGASGTLRTGTVLCQFDTPVQGVEEFQNMRNGVFLNGASVTGTGLITMYQTYANRFTGVAVGNPFSFTTYCTAEFIDGNGNSLGSKVYTLPPYGQTSFNVGTAFPSAGSGPGSISLTCDSGTSDNDYSTVTPFVALTIAGDSRGMTSSLPPGAYSLPSDKVGLVNNSFTQLVKVLNESGLNVGHPKLTLLDNPVINAYYTPSTDTVSVEMALLELLADSPSEVAWVLAHELGHAYQRLNGLNFDNNLELDADAFSLIGMLLTGYDAYAAAGTLGKLGMATERTSLWAQSFDNITTADLHTSFTNRMGLILDEIQYISTIQGLEKFVQNEHNLFHPHMPSSVTPLFQAGTGHQFKPFKRTIQK